MALLYFKVSEKVLKHRDKGFFHRHIMSIPWKVLKEFSKFIFINKNIYSNKIIKSIKFQSDIIVSITSYPKRISKLHITIRSILNQSFPPKKILIWLSKEEFPDELDSLPASLKKMLRYNVEIRFVEENLKSHKKYFYAFKEYPEEIIVTMDDDIIYYPNTIERLLSIHKRFPNAICANIIKKIEVDKDQFLSYVKWTNIKSKEFIHSKQFLAVGIGGVLYPPKLINTDVLFDVEKIFKLCLSADDLWLKACSFMVNTEVATGGSFYPNPITIPNTQKDGLRVINVNNNMNDIQWKKICDYLTLKPNYFR